MHPVLRFLTSSIGKKVQMALTGLLLCGFLIAHLGGNLLLYKGAETFNGYAEVLEGNPVLPAVELGLLVLFLLHILTGVWTHVETRRARPVGYSCRSSAGGSTWGSTTMAYSGLLLVVFLAVHLKTFRFPGEQAREDLYALVMQAFASKPYAIFYVAAMAALGLHLSHGFQSGFQTLGLHHPKYTPLIRRLGPAFAAIMALGFASIPIWAGFFARSCCP